jgi:Spy/CpxP family protein refolding chaperone
MKPLAWIFMITVASTLAAQEPADSGGGDAPTAQAQQLRQRIRQRWNQHVRTTLGLNDEQTARLQGTEQRFEEQRQPLRVRQREITQTLNGELAAGTPNQERVKQLVNERQENQRKLQEINRSEDREMETYLSPVQRARYQEERRRFQERVAEVVRHRREARRQTPGEGPRGGVRKRPRP